ncbi:26S protease regulatory subunit 6A [Trichuris trichiura]|uniref:26S protease regulatory subunit 6A n=1 Tax=Trichuris trichiura TaxID=36087 RepID=A0A077Z8N0_TRITR|nr:26S protease regulatory subunit 6A [Trichuris trichiura]
MVRLLPAKQFPQCSQFCLENKRRLKLFHKLPLVVAMIVEIVTLDENSICDKLAAKIVVSQKNNVGIIVKTGDERGVYFLPNPGFVPLQMLVPGELVGLHRKNRVILEMLPPCHDVRIQAMELDERPKDSYSDIGGLDAQIQELIEAIVLPITKKELFNKLGIIPSKGVLLYGPPGTGKTMLARAVAAQTKSTFLRLTGTLLIRMYIGEGAKMVRQTFELARAKAPSIIFIDEVDAIGMSRCSSERGSSREIQRTMMELLNQLDGFPVNADVRLICATNRVDILDPALLRSGRIDRKIEIPMPNEVARSRIMQLHARKMRVDPSVNFAEIASFAHDFNGAQCKAVVIEAGMIALRKNKAVISHQDFVEAVAEVQSNQKKSLHELYV